MSTQLSFIISMLSTHKSRLSLLLDAKESFAEVESGIYLWL